MYLPEMAKHYRNYLRLMIKPEKREDFNFDEILGEEEGGKGGGKGGAEEEEKIGRGEEGEGKRMEGEEARKKLFQPHSLEKTQVNIGRGEREEGAGRKEEEGGGREEGGALLIFNLGIDQTKGGRASIYFGFPQSRTVKTKTVKIDVSAANESCFLLFQIDM